MKIRVGMGFDVHELEAGREFFLGGVRLPDAPKGAVGHSDADVLIHAICDALLGAANLRDIGFHFSNTDNRWKGMDSKFFEKPKVNPHIPEMKRILAPLMNIGEDDVSIKATTNETMGYVGREEGICAYAVALIQQG